MTVRKSLLALLAITAAITTEAPARADETVRILTAQPGWQAISVWYAKDLGLFKKYNVDVQHTPLDSSPSVMEAFVSGQSDMAIANVGTAVNAYFRGVPLRILAGTPASDYPIMAVSSSIDGVAGLKGKKIAVWSVPSDATLALNALVEAKYGLTPAKDLTYVKVPAQNVCDTIRRNQADAGIVFEPFASSCLTSGAHRVAAAGTVSFDPPKLVSSSVIIVNADFLEKHTHAVEAVLSALDEAVTWAAKNKTAAVQSLAQYSGQPESAIGLSYDSANFDIAIDRSYHDILLKHYQEAGLIKQIPTTEDLAKLYQTNLLKH
jgi:ABC-type nitrate/sulfonate/bicarbonate transport system substrate-binding protein